MAPSPIRFPRAADGCSRSCSASPPSWSPPTRCPRRWRCATCPAGRPPVRLLLGGAAGNLGDRLFRAPGPLRGSVVDWLNLPHFPWTFNLADASITCAAVLVAILALSGIRIDGTSPAAAARETRGEQAADTP